MNHSVVFLYTELAGYIRNCFERLASSGVEVHVIAYPVNPEAPFQFKEESQVKYYERRAMSTEAIFDLIKRVEPDAVFCSGWIDQDYIQVMKQVPLTVNRVLISDNAFLGSLRDRASLLRAKTSYRNLFDFAFVSGDPQRVYAEKMGFRKNEVFTGFYTANEKTYLNLKTKNDEASFPKRFVFVGRYLEFKGVLDLWKVFSELQPSDWELHCVGIGDLWDQRLISKGITHHGFLQPGELLNLMKEGGVFILPSHKEPWGVVVHEFAAAGFPLLLSDKVNSGTCFLIEERNGFSFKAKSMTALQHSLDKIMSLSSSELNEMSKFSREFSKQMSVSRWLKTVEVIVNRRK